MNIDSVLIVFVVGCLLSGIWLIVKMYFKIGYLMREDIVNKTAIIKAEDCIQANNDLHEAKYEKLTNVISQLNINVVKLTSVTELLLEDRHYNSNKKK